MEFRFRPATSADVARMSRAIVDGIAGYASFAGDGWTPPALERESRHLGELLLGENVWSLLAESGDELAGQVTLVPATIAIHGSDDPAMAHLRNLFVEEPWWGSGLATTLNTAAVDAARDRGFERMRLFTPALHARARRFYEREGWTQEGEAFDEPGLGLALVEYRHALR